MSANARITVEIERSSVSGKHSIVVLVAAASHPCNLMRAEVDPGRCSGREDLETLLRTVAAAAAEKLGEEYGYDIDPGQVYRDVVPVFHQAALQLT